MRSRKCQASASTIAWIAYLVGRDSVLPRVVSRAVGGSPALSRVRKTFCDVGRKLRASSGQFWWVSSIKETALQDLQCRAQGFAMSPGNKGAPAGSFGGPRALKEGALKDLRCLRETTVLPRAVLVGLQYKGERTRGFAMTQ